MPLTPAHGWSVSLGTTAVLWQLFPGHRALSGAMLGLHVPVLAWGICSIRSGFFGPVFCRGPRASAHVALSFDDGPDPQLTPGVLELLDAFGALATFFVVARRAERHAGIMRRMIQAGHSVQCHGLDHSPWSNFQVGPWLRRDLSLSCRIIGDICGHKPAWYRPPMGLMNPHVFAALRQLDMRCAGWSRRAVDFGNRLPRALRRIPRLAGPGDIVLLHDTAPDHSRRDLFLASLRQLLQRCRSEALSCVTIDTLATMASPSPTNSTGP